jgi:hypothetical protein
VSLYAHLLGIAAFLRVAHCSQGTMAFQQQLANCSGRFREPEDNLAQIGDKNEEQRRRP